MTSKHVHLALALSVVVVLSVAACGGTAASTSPTPSAAFAAVPVANVPRVLPPAGVIVNHFAKLLPAANGASPPVSKTQALGMAPNLQGLAARALLARVTVPGTKGAVDPIERRLCWVVVFTFPAPIDASSGGPSPPSGSSPAPPHLVRYRVDLVDASSGKVLMMFFTP